jgi:hypothetical protein
MSQLSGCGCFLLKALKSNPSEPFMHSTAGKWFWCLFIKAFEVQSFETCDAHCHGCVLIVFIVSYCTEFSTIIGTEVKREVNTKDLFL